MIKDKITKEMIKQVPGLRKIIEKAKQNGQIDPKMANNLLSQIDFAMQQPDIKIDITEKCKHCGEKIVPGTLPPLVCTNCERLIKLSESVENAELHK